MPKGTKGETNMKEKKLLTKKILLAALLTVPFCITGCSKGGGEAEKTITVSVFDRGNVPASEGTYENNRWTKFINENSGVNVKWVPIPRNEAKQKFSMLVAAGEAPDLICDYDASLFSAFIKQGVLQSVDEPIEKYSTAYKKYLEENPELNDFITFDGKKYLITSKRSQDSVLNHGVWIRQDWLDKLNLKMPETDEELLNVARAFRDGDPDGNGVNDTTAMAVINWHEIFPSMYQSSKLWYNEGGTLKFGRTLDRYADALGYMKTLYDEGLIDKEFITDNDNSRQTQLWTTGKSGILTQTWRSTMSKELLLNDPDAKPVPLKPVSTKYGTNSFWKEAAPGYYVGFNKNLKDTESAMKFIDWMIDKGWFNIKFGNEGEHYNLVDGVPQIIDQAKFTNEVEYALDYAIVSQWQVKPEWIPVMAAQDDISQTLAKLQEESMKVNSSVDFRRDIPVDPRIDDVVSVIDAFEPLHDSIRMKVISGGAQYTPEWGIQELRSEWKRVGGDNAEALMNEWYKSNK